MPPASSFQGLGDLPGGRFESVALNVSPDGVVVLGWSRSERGDEPVRWRAGELSVDSGAEGGFTERVEIFVELE